jgi:hypothetical protein
MLVKTSPIECAKEGYCKIFEFKVFDNIFEGLNAAVVIAIELLFNLI